MHEAHVGEVTSLGTPTQLLWVQQPRRRRYRTRVRSTAPRGHSYLGGLEQRQDYQRLLARLVRSSETFQRSLTAEQRRTWLVLEDALLDHAWLLQGYYFKAGYELGKTRTQRRHAVLRVEAQGAHPTDRAVGELREQAGLLAAVAKLLESVVDDAR